MCIFPHSTVEEQWWNKWQEKGIDELALTQVAKQFYIRSRDGALLSGGEVYHTGAERCREDNGC